MSDTIMLTPLSERQIPTIVSYDASVKSYMVGDEARRLGLLGQTNAYNFKEYLGRGPASVNKKRFWIAPSGEYDSNVITISAYEAAKVFINKVCENYDLPDKIVVGVPVVNDKAWLENYRSNIRKIFSELNLASPDFFHEPLAIYNSYKKSAAMNSVLAGGDVLVVDVGGSTFSSCVVRTNSEGNIFRSGAYSVPIGINGDFEGGKKIDVEILNLIVQKASRKGIVWKDDPISRSINGRKPVLLHVEDLKLRICKKMKNCKIKDPCDIFKETFVSQKGWLHPDMQVEVVVTGDDIKRIVEKVWRESWLPIIKNTISDSNLRIKQSKSKDKDKVKIETIITAGGSSNIPFFNFLLYKSFADSVRLDRVLRSSNVAASVSYGLAYECKYASEKKPEFTSDRLAPCVLNELYFGVRKSRTSSIIPVNVVSDGFSNKDGRLVYSRQVIDEYEVDVDIIIPFDIEDKVFFDFSDVPFSEAKYGECALLSSDVAQIPFDGKVHRKAKIKVLFKRDGYVHPVFSVKGKGQKATDGWSALELHSFKYSDLKINYGNVFYGFDFGNSNSFMYKMHVKRKDSCVIETYPTHFVDDKVKNKLVAIAHRMKSVDQTSSNIALYAEHIKIDHVYHSNKLEKKEFSKGETQHIIQSDKIKSTAEFEVKNLEIAYSWMLSNYSQLSDSPEQFCRELNRLLLGGIMETAGDYRNGPVVISGAKVVPPVSASVPDMMYELSKEIKAGSLSRSPLEFAVAIHTKFVFIHPFEDGNGRTARLLLNAILLSNSYLPLIVSSEDRDRYISCLDVAVYGDISSILMFFIDEYKTCIKHYGEFLDHSKSLKGEHLVEGEDRPSDVFPLLPHQDVHFHDVCTLLFTGVVHLFEYVANIAMVKHPNIKIHFDKYGIPSVDFFSSVNGGSFKPLKWFFMISFAAGKNNEKFLFYFDGSTGINLDNLEFQCIYLNVARKQDGVYEDLSIEPLHLRDISIANDSLIVSPGLSRLDEATVTTFFDEIISLYF